MEAARPGVPGDLPAVLHLARQGIAELAPNRGGAVWRQREARPEPLDAELTHLLSGQRDDALAVVGTIDDTVVGYGTMTLDPMHDGELLAVISDLYVDPEARGIGVGEAMMDLLVARAREAGAIGVDAIALPGDRHTKNFFETFGLVARAILVHKSLRPAPDEPVDLGSAAPGPVGTEADPR